MYVYVVTATKFGE